MKDQKRKPPVVVPFNTQPNPKPPHYALAMEVGELKSLCAKLLYRIQQVERREKDLISANRSLRREVNALKKSQTRPLDAAPSVQSKPAVSQVPSPLRQLSNSSPPMEDFHSAIEELNGNQNRH